MHNYDLGSSSGTWAQTPGDDPGACHHRSVLSLVLMIVGIALAATIGLSLVFWAFGFLFSILGFVLRVAIVVAVAAFVWKRVMRHRSRRYDS